MVDGTSRHGAGECGRGDRRAYADIVGLFLHDGASGHQGASGGASGGHQVRIRGHPGASGALGLWGAW